MELSKQTYPRLQPSSRTRFPRTPSPTGRERLFTLTYDMRKRKSANPSFNVQKTNSVSFRGVQWIDGRVSLETGDLYLALDEMKDHFAQMGKYTLTFDDEELEP